ncbi:hypothetical protein CHLNCDRAFT_144092 [Chlorella variabilis]|uniref:Rad60/SUMO-like domain-containing protein n=1 Tax=Chlorella variabilis TaxID=554065 RepID=E1ZBV9_CHLVA|nr:hypothetical protein CHLNCDRAFT_144092 [Chlorella variabilis]EFN56709.1 hypothetical protein CHLNCDRAFT_144092 [Chlorella variabilis]|eukprot:XP_005848811.1 hypothetical protein CHLNCDRAFT_144092 [Chlorella variabilis]
MDDLWGYGGDEPEPDHFSDSSDDRRRARSDSEEADLLPQKKRLKLRQLGYGNGGRRGRRGARGGIGQGGEGDAEVLVLDSDDDSDRQLLREAARGGAAGRSTASSLAAATAAAAAATAAAAAAGASRAPAWRQGSGGAAAALDPRSAALLQQAQAIQQRLKAAQEEELSEDEDSEAPDPSPVVLRGAAAAGAAAAAARQRQQQAQQPRCSRRCDLDLTGDGSEEGSPGSGAAAGSEEGEGSPGVAGGSPLPQAAAAADEGRISLKLRSAHAGEKVMRMRREDPFSKLFAAYRSWAAEAGHISSADAALRFLFDGDQLGPGQTPASLELEGDECIDVYF